MKYLITFLFSLMALVGNSTVLYPGLAVDVQHNALTGEHAPSWSVDNPTISLSSVGFLCHVTAKAYFGGTATVTCTYQDRIGNSEYTRTKSWSFTCTDTKISVSPTSKTIAIGESFKIAWSFDKATYITPGMQFTGYDPNIVDVTNYGMVTAKAEGSTKIYVKSDIGTNSAICSVRVKKQSTPGSETNTMPYDNWDSSNTKEIILTEPGTLSDFISDSEKYKITNLTLAGPLNGSDLRLLRDMVGLDCNLNVTSGKLEVIDLKNAFFVAGGPWYLYEKDYYHYTSDILELPEYLFAWSKTIKKIRFPKYVTSVSNSGTLQCDNLEELAIPPGCTTIDYYCLNGRILGALPMSTLTLPSSIENFKASVYRCPNLTYIYCYATVPPVIDYPSDFKSQTNISKGTLYVPKGTAQAYWRAEGWRAFKDIKETLDIYHPLTIRVEPNGKVKFREETVYQSYPIWYSGIQTFEIEENECPQIEIIPDEGYTVAEVKLVNRNDVLIKDYDNSKNVTLDKTTQPSILKVSFKESSSIASTFVESESPVQVYNLQGILIGSFQSEESVQGLQKGIYLIKNGSSTKKLVVH